MGLSSPTNTHARVPWRALTVALLLLASLFAITGLSLDLPAAALVLAGSLFVALTLILMITLSLTGARFGPADRVTLLRASLVLFLASITPFPETLARMAWPYAAICLMALLLDGVDGYIARRTRTASAYGARFDMELDAFFILILCLAVMVLGKAGPWVLLIGLMRYGFVIAAWQWPWLNDPLPESIRRKTLCVWQLVTLMVALLPVTPAPFARATLMTAIILLAWSFAVDIRQLYPGPGRPTRPAP